MAPKWKRVVMTNIMSSESESEKTSAPEKNPAVVAAAPVAPTASAPPPLAPTATPAPKPKRKLSEAQLENLERGRAKAKEARAALGEKKRLV